MNLTKGQKDALLRKVQNIISNKKDEFRKKFLDKWSISTHEKYVLNQFHEMQKLRMKMQVIADELKLDRQYSSYRLHEKCGDILFYFDSDKSWADVYINYLKEKAIDDATIKFSTKFPADYQIQDEIELLGLSKDFDMSKFLEKYEAL